MIFPGPKRKRVGGIVLLSAVCLLIVACAPGENAADDDDDNDNNDNDNDDNDDNDNNDDDNDDDVDCNDINWSTEEHYLAKGSIVAKWDQTAFIDQNENGKIDEDEEEDKDLTFVDLCERSGDGKKSLVLMMATDE